MSELILEKRDPNINIPHVTDDTLSLISQTSVEYSIVKYQNIFKDLFITRVAKFQNTVGHFVLELLNTMKNVVVGNGIFKNPREVRNLIDTFNNNKCQLPNNLNSENYISTKLIIQ